jgi:hypothetical protein
VLLRGLLTIASSSRSSIPSYARSILTTIEKALSGQARYGFENFLRVSINKIRQ